MLSMKGGKHVNRNKEPIINAGRWDTSANHVTAYFSPSHPTPPLIFQTMLADF